MAERWAESRGKLTTERSLMVTTVWATMATSISERRCPLQHSGGLLEGVWTCTHGGGGDAGAVVAFTDQTLAHDGLRRSLLFHRGLGEESAEEKWASCRRLGCRKMRTLCGGGPRVKRWTVNVVVARTRERRWRERGSEYEEVGEKGIYHGLKECWNIFKLLSKSVI